MPKLLTFILIVIWLIIGGVWSVKIAYAQTPPPASHLFLFNRNNPVIKEASRTRKVKVELTWQEYGITKTINYYSTIKDLSTP